MFKVLGSNAKSSHVASLGKLLRYCATAHTPENYKNSISSPFDARVGNLLTMLLKTRLLHFISFQIGLIRGEQ